MEVLPNNSFQTRIKNLISMAGSQDKLGALCGISGVMIGKYLSGKAKPGSNKLRALAEATGVSLEWLLTGVGSMKRGEDLPPGAVRPLVWENEDDLGDDYYLIPRYDVHADCGSGAVVEHEQVIEKLAFVKRWVNAHHQPADLFLITAQGDSMLPTIYEGDILLVDKSRKRVSDDGVYIMSVDHELIAKRLQRLFDGSVRIVSDNKAYPEQMVPADQTEKLDIVGRVVWKGGRM